MRRCAQLGLAAINLKAIGVEEIHAVIAAERPAFDHEPVVVSAGVAFLGVGAEWLCSLGQFVVGAQIYPVVFDEPEARLPVVGRR